MNEAVLYFHQGWTDIINCLSLVHYYSKQYETLYVLIREDARDLFLYTFADCPTIIPITVDREAIEDIHPYDMIECAGLNSSSVDLLFHGIHDVYRDDMYTGVFNCAFENDMCFVEAFYSPYDIPYSVRIDDFMISRDKEREKLVYETFVERYGTEYGLKHGCEAISTEFPIVELGEISTYFFDIFLVLERAKEIHVIDSVWAAILYLLQAKYGICASIPVYLYCKRGYETMFSSPVKHPNWIWM